MFKKEVNTGNIEEMFYFLKNHYRYYDDWSSCRQVANDVKVHHLMLEGNPDTALNMLNYSEYYEVNFIINQWIQTHKGCEVRFAGRSGGYLILTDTSNNTVLPDCVTDCQDMDDVQAYINEYGLMYTQHELQEATELLQSFDALTDELRDCVNDLSKSSIQYCILEDATYKFNDEYESDLTLFNIAILEYNEEYDAIDITSIYSIKCLSECLTKSLSFIADYGYCLYEFKKDGKMFLSFK